MGKAPAAISGHSAATLLLVGAASGGCGLEREVPYEKDTAVIQRLYQFSREGPHGARRRLEGMTAFAWDELHLFGEGTEYRYIDDVVGTAVFDRGAGASGSRGRCWSSRFAASSSTPWP